MVQVCCETEKMPWYEKKPKEVVEISDSAQVKDPQGKNKDDARIEESLDEDMDKTTKFGVSLEGNKNKRRILGISVEERHKGKEQNSGRLENRGM